MIHIAKQIGGGDTSELEAEIASLNKKLKVANEGKTKAETALDTLQKSIDTAQAKVKPKAK